MPSKCGVKVPLLVPKVESVCARVATELGRKKIKPMITTDSLSVFFQGCRKTNTTEG